MPDVLDRDERPANDVKREQAAKMSAKEQGWRAGVSPAMRWAYWQYLKNWRRCGEKGRRWAVQDVATAHNRLAEALAKGEKEKVAGLRKFLLMGDCGEMPAESTEHESS